MKFAVVQFPGSNCDQDCLAALRGIEGIEAEYVWHKETSLGDADAIVFPGGFSYGDYLRCGAIARFSPIMRAVIEEARAGKMVIGICNGFQILCEAGLLPARWSAIARFISSALTCTRGSRRPTRRSSTAHRSGRFCRSRSPMAKAAILPMKKRCARLNERQQVLLRYCDADGKITAPQIQMARWKTSPASATASAMSSA